KLLELTSAQPQRQGEADLRPVPTPRLVGGGLRRRWPRGEQAEQRTRGERPSPDHGASTVEALMAHFGRRRDRLIIGRERIARAADDRYGLERHLPDLRIVGRKRVAKGKVRRAVLRVHRHGLRQGAELLEAAGHAAEQLDLDGLGVPPTVDADDNAPGLARARRIRRREFRYRYVSRPDVR